MRRFIRGPYGYFSLSPTTVRSRQIVLPLGFVSAPTCSFGALLAWVLGYTHALHFLPPVLQVFPSTDRIRSKGAGVWQPENGRRPLLGAVCFWLASQTTRASKLPLSVTPGGAFFAISHKASMPRALISAPSICPLSLCGRPHRPRRRHRLISSGMPSRHRSRTSTVPRHGRPLTLRTRRKSMHCSRPTLPGSGKLSFSSIGTAVNFASVVVPAGTLGCGSGAAARSRSRRDLMPSAR